MPHLLRSSPIPVVGHGLTGSCSARTEEGLEVATGQGLSWPAVKQELSIETGGNGVFDARINSLPLGTARDLCHVIRVR